MRWFLAVALLVLVGAGCHYHGHSRRSYPSEWNGRTVATHVHADGCGHYFWHGAWQGSAHPGDCTACAAPDVGPEPVPATVYSEPVYVERPRVYVTHSHHSGCGHFFWHGGWYGHPHPATCHCHVPRYSPPRVTIGFGFGSGYRYGGYSRGYTRYGGHYRYDRHCR
jgi:hypothetical protein